MKYLHSSKKGNNSSLATLRKLKYFTLSLVLAGAISILFFATPLRHVSFSNHSKQKPLLPTPSFEARSPELSIASGSKRATTQSTQSVLFAHDNVVTTVFWVGETAGRDNGGIANKASAWDEHWQQHYGGVDNPSNRNGYKPAGFTPNENPFYIALPYNDLNNDGARKSQASGYISTAFVSTTSYPWFKNSWVAIKYKDTIVYAQWEDVGPFEEDDASYVFGTAQPKNQRDQKAGLDISPAVKEYLGVSDVSRTAWTFISANQVPYGPWKEQLTSYPGETVE